MATRWSIAEAFVKRTAGTIEERVDIGRRMPVFATATAEEIIAAMPPHISARVIEQYLEGKKGTSALEGEDAPEADEDDEDEEVAPAKPSKKAPVAAAVAAKPAKAAAKRQPVVADEDEDEEDEDEEVVPAKPSKKAAAAAKPAPKGRKATVFDDDED